MSDTTETPEMDGMERPSRSVRETIELNHLRSKLLLVTTQAGNVLRCATHSEVATLADRVQKGANAEISRIEEMLQ